MGMAVELRKTIVERPKTNERLSLGERMRLKIRSVIEGVKKLGKGEEADEQPYYLKTTISPQSVERDVSEQNSHLDIEVDLTEMAVGPHIRLRELEKSKEFIQLFTEISKIEGKIIPKEEKEVQKQILLQQFAMTVVEEEVENLDTQGALLNMTFSEKKEQFLAEIAQVLEEVKGTVALGQINSIHDVSNIETAANQILSNANESDYGNHLEQLTRQIAGAINRAEEDKDPLVNRLDDLLDLSLAAKKSTSDPEEVKSLLYEIKQKCSEFIDQRQKEAQKVFEAYSEKAENLMETIEDTRFALSSALQNAVHSKGADKSIHLKGEFLGRGGIGEVSRGYQFGDRVAIKLITPDKGAEVLASNNAEVVQRLVKATHASDHLMTSHGSMRLKNKEPNKPDNRLDVLEYIEEPVFLIDLLERGELAGADYLNIMADAAEGAKALHEEGIIHRDIKIANIMVIQNDDGSKKGVLMDYEMACLEGHEDEYVLGTPAYMSPEQFRTEVVTSKSDVYSLAKAIFVDWGGKSPRGSNEILRAALRESYDVSQTSMPESLKPVIKRALSANPANRPDMGELIAALREASKVSTNTNQAQSAEPSGLIDHPGESKEKAA